MRPGTAARGIVMAMALMLARPVVASPPLEGVLACRGIANNAARLACFDRESALVAAHVQATAGERQPPAEASTPAGAPATPAAVAGPAAAHDSALDRLQTFGIPPAQILEREEAARKAPPPLQHIEAHIVGMAGMGDGREIFTLDNHQVWAELEPDGDLYAKPGASVEISRGWLGSYSLSLKSRRNAKVTRLQ
jgi:hypothetical protein